MEVSERVGRALAGVIASFFLLTLEPCMLMRLVSISSWPRTSFHSPSISSRQSDCLRLAKRGARASCLPRSEEKASEMSPPTRLGATAAVASVRRAWERRADLRASRDMW